MLMHQLFIISDGTGWTAEQSVRAALTQFGENKVVINVRPNIRKGEQVLQVVKEAENVNGSIVHTVVSKKLRNKILKYSKLHNIETIDMMSPLLAQLTHVLAHSPSETPGLYHKLNKAYFQRIEAIEFAFRHDNGLKTEELDKAEIILLGVSRTFKTPLSVYLAFKGWLVANVPVILNMPLPDIINKIPTERIFCLTTYPNRLAQLRSIRDKHLGGDIGNYADVRHVQEELRYASRIYQAHTKWARINVTNKPIEEIASEIISIMKKRKIPRTYSSDVDND
jgi:regulator of PEP synthase PpsR (kinase-PPPase family)